MSSRFVSPSLFLFLCAACGSESPSGLSSTTLEAGSLAEPCNFTAGCLDGLVCAYVQVGGDEDPICIDLATICRDIDCGDSDCVIAESFPVQVYCSGSAGDGADDPMCSDDECMAPSGSSGEAPPSSGSAGDNEGSDDRSDGDGNESAALGAYCDLETPCDENLFCAYVGPSTTATCVGPSVCDDLDCDPGQCAINESFPARVFCSGTAGDDGEDPVCSDGSCPDSGPSCTGDDCSSPSNPGQP